MTTTIKVEQRHIDAGVHFTTDFCPIALAIYDQLGVEAQVFSSGVIELNGKVFFTPKQVYQFLADFDRKKPVTPFEFELPLK